LAYTRAGFKRKSGMEQIQGFKSLRFLLTNSKVPRDTKKLVAGVGQKKIDEPELVDSILEAIQSITDEARRALADPELPRASLLYLLSALIHENHGYLVALGVSHSTLETIKDKTSAEPYRLSTKLTGAGGGGCAVTLVPDDFKAQDLEILITELIREGFQPYLTSVGGSGLGILSPYAHHRNRKSTPAPHAVHPAGQITPPETPMPSVAAEATLNSVDANVLRVPFETSSIEDLPTWADDLGRWLYV